MSDSTERILPPNNGKVVLLTGVNGYIASHIGLQLLRKGYSVRGVARSSSAGSHLLSGAFRGYEERYEHVEVRDITISKAFDQAVQGVHSIIHTASPIDLSLQSVDDFIVPAVQGNLSLLDSAKNAGPQLTSFVLTSSISAIHDRWKNPKDYAYTEMDWNTSGEAIARQQFSPWVAYGSSKAVAEKALWIWVDANKPTFSCAAINPGVVTGPPVSWPPTPDKLNSTLQPVWKIYSGEVTEIPPGIGAMTFIDVRDTAALHIWCMENPGQSRGQRYLATNGKATPQAIADILRNQYPNREIVMGNPKSDYRPDYWYPVGETSSVASKAYTALGSDRLTLFDKSILDTVEAFESHWPGLANNFK